ncbi:hypothetical protein E2C01_092349 [Portunus trituberculatus]|uniref:Uncharacterized protein n=1 Tax=Portunus trituberculatus TaxID=210409 RepID=A0A5B7JJV4_PORTR|nr:hypothetical protein [Portunus trituberculatus]
MHPTSRPERYANNTVQPFSHEVCGGLCLTITTTITTTTNNNISNNNSRNNLSKSVRITSTIT